ncbi:ATP-binding protein [Corynebacterium sp. AOP40-9SA-29]|uniref:ATP-binding protein n=1 Tax=Corynebacterium sp. AOP40-9SA-29 TaxID=3457677 RepID=UPI0040338B6C
MVSYLSRAVDDELAMLMQGVPAVALQGPKGVGKTASAGRLARSILWLDRPGQLATIKADRGMVERLDPPVLIDEWQLDPPVWDAVRRSVDEDRSAGRFLLTGSANPQGARVHSGAGRIVNVRMRPMGFSERQLEEPTVSLASLAEGAAGGGAALHGRTSLTLVDYTREILSSGFPGIRDGADRFRARELNSYLELALSQEVPALGTVVRRPQSLRSWLQAYAAATSTTASFQSIADAVSPTERPSRDTVLDYRDALTNLWLLDPVPAWSPRGVGVKRLGGAPKHQLADPALAARLLGATQRSLLGSTTEADQLPEFRKFRDGPLLGALFESLVTLTVRVLAQANDLEVSHLRTQGGDHEVDMILTSEEGDVVAVEVKLAEDVGARDVKHLNWLHQQLGDRVVAKVIITTGEFAYRREDGVAVVPLSLLGP